MDKLIIKGIDMSLSKDDVINYLVDEQMAPRLVEVEKLRKEYAELQKKRDESYQKVAAEVTSLTAKRAEELLPGGKIDVAGFTLKLHVFAYDTNNLRADADTFVAIATITDSQTGYQLTGEDRLDISVTDTLRKLLEDRDCANVEFNTMNTACNIANDRCSVRAKTAMAAEIKTRLVKAAIEEANGELKKLASHMES